MTDNNVIDLANRRTRLRPDDEDEVNVERWADEVFAGRTSMSYFEWLETRRAVDRADREWAVRDHEAGEALPARLRATLADRAASVPHGDLRALVKLLVAADLRFVAEPLVEEIFRREGRAYEPPVDKKILDDAEKELDPDSG